MRKPNFNNLLKVLEHTVPERPTLFEFFMNDKIYRKLTGVTKPADDMSPLENIRMVTNAFCAAGYDYATVPSWYLKGSLSFPSGKKESKATHSLNDGTIITDRASFNAYAWPEIHAAAYAPLKDMESSLPRGMKLIGSCPGGVLENAINLVGYENLCFILLDDPALARDIFDNIGSRLLRHVELCVGYRAVGAVISNDDWGFKTQTMISPADMRTYVFPWHKKIVAAAHAAGKPALLHSCGDLHEVMDDIIDDMRFDGKHSYEDTICPVEDAYEKYHQRIAILGGIDLNFLCRSTEEEVYARSAAMLDRAASRGSFALGTGNSVPEFVPQENYFAMLRAAVGEIVFPEEKTVLQHA